MRSQSRSSNNGLISRSSRQSSHGAIRLLATDVYTFFNSFC
jgi:hypothetical protein